jgi:hypothetical protein
MGTSARRALLRSRGDHDRPDTDAVDEIVQPGEVIGMSGVDREAVGVRGGGDEQIGDTPSR